MKASKVRAQTKPKRKRARPRLLPRGKGKGGKHITEIKLYNVGSRTVLSWLILAGVIPLNDVIQYRNPKDDVVIKEGFVSWDGITCKCCNNVLSVSKFKIHAGFKFNRLCLNLYMESGKPFTLCQLQAWSAEYKTKKNGIQKVEADENDRNDDSCGLCGDGGDLICCDSCPSSIHLACLSMQELPEGDWYCVMV
ncbi:increased DNA methylation 1, REPRESSOR OF SILENCING 4 [Hibiscus trionum]|uniref:Increased DNA methylation 1, REPRESSOR OF SILENCING 4 n=1 Tax=Hibiscus trionum TaxID=183268 RepID=A0A9W7M2N9_HIBTR|nr:increased DNA methylation 1, REPRESSOR OF SILENCING 4 [Hibiscus trionum]